MMSFVALPFQVFQLTHSTLQAGLLGIVELVPLLLTAFAGGADCVSVIFRTTIWNETIPDNIRGRMASLEMISYMSGPLLRNAQAGLMASVFGLHQAITLGGTLSIVGVCISALLLPGFWKYAKAK